MKHKVNYQKKKWAKPELKTLGFKQTLGGLDKGYPEIEGGTIS